MPVITEFYECGYYCGFTGTYDQVMWHEKTCENKEE